MNSIPVGPPVSVRNLIVDIENVIDENPIEKIDIDIVNELRKQINNKKGEINDAKDDLTVSLKSLEKKIDENAGASEKHSPDIEEYERQNRYLKRYERNLKELDNADRQVKSIYFRVAVLTKKREILGNGVESIFRWSVLVLIFIVLTALSVELFFTEHLNRTALFYIFLIDLAACVVFQFEFFFRMYCAEKGNRWHFFWNNIVDFLSSIPVPAFWLGPGTDSLLWLRVFRAIRILRLWRAFRIASLIWRGMQRFHARATVNRMKIAFVISAFLIVAGAIAVNVLEQQHSNIDAEVIDFSQSIWWSFNTVAIGGYADLYEPQHPLTQLITALLLMFGLIFWSAFIATLSMIFMGDDKEDLSNAVLELEEILMHEIRHNIEPKIAQLQSKIKSE